MTLDASGNLAVGTTTAGYTAANRNVMFVNGALSSLIGMAYGGTNGGYLYCDSGGIILWTEGSRTLNLGTASAGPIVFTTNNTERARIDSSGNLIVGSAAVFPSPSLINVVTASGIACGFAFSDNTAGIRGRLWWGGGTDGVSLFNSDNSPLRFGTTAAERARITDTGNFLVGATSLAYNEKLSVASTSAQQIMALRQTDNDNANDKILFVNTNGIVGYVRTSGAATTYNTSSDYRLKNSIVPITGALAKVSLLKPVTYKWNCNGSDGQGFIAHELAEVVPDCVTGEKDAVDAEGNPQYQGIDTSFLVATLTAAIQELKAELDSVKSELATIKGAA
jgi:hypothetical protein